MYKECKSKQSSARQKALEQHLLQKLLEVRYDDLSINDLCEELSINRKTFYRYFSGKQGALHAVIDHTLSELDDRILETYRLAQNDPNAYQIAFFRFWVEHKTFLRAIDHSDLWTVFVERAIDYLAEDSWPREHNTPAEYDLRFRFLSEFLIAGAARILDQWCLSDFQQTPEQLAAVAAKDLTQILDYWKTPKE